MLTDVLSLFLVVIGLVGALVIGIIVGKKMNKTKVDKMTNQVREQKTEEKSVNIAESTEYFKWLAIIGIVFGIIAFVSSFLTESLNITLGFPMGLGAMAILCGIIPLIKIKEKNQVKNLGGISLGLGGAVVIIVIIDIIELIIFQ